mmetsp:Transcript_15866/g.43729  ORF Transcript_15866/g.43729 Transcript_15866/m.43729 type:complete len:302 (-) Transcript_15866:377-1282(-)
MQFSSDHDNANTIGSLIRCLSPSEGIHSKRAVTSLNNLDGDTLVENKSLAGDHFLGGIGLFIIIRHQLVVSGIVCLAAAASTIATPIISHAATAFTTAAARTAVTATDFVVLVIATRRRTDGAETDKGRKPDAGLQEHLNWQHAQNAKNRHGRKANHRHEASTLQALHEFRALTFRLSRGAAAAAVQHNGRGKNKKVHERKLLKRVLLIFARHRLLVDAGGSGLFESVEAVATVLRDASLMVGFKEALALFRTKGQKQIVANLVHIVRSNFAQTTSNAEFVAALFRNTLQHDMSMLREALS